MLNVQNIVIGLFLAAVLSALFFLPEGAVIDAQGIVLALFFAFVISGSLLLHRLIYPFSFALLPDWKTTYILAAGLFVFVFVTLLTQGASPRN